MLHYLRYPLIRVARLSAFRFIRFIRGTRAGFTLLSLLLISPER
jgi:hypothetical protein